MKKLTLLLALALCSFVGAKAKSVVFTLADGTKVYYLLGGQTNPVLRFVDGKVTVDADEYTISDIKRFTISDEDDPTAIEPQLARLPFSLSGNTLVVRAADVKTVKVYTAGGAEVAVDVQRADDLVSVSLNGLPKGIYVVSTGNASLKVAKK